MTALGLNKQDYWRFLRREYGMSAVEAWEYIKRVGFPPTVDAVREAIYPRPNSAGGITYFQTIDDFIGEK